MEVVKEWQKELSGNMYSAAIDSQNNIYTGDNAKYLTKFSYDGTKIWQKKLLGKVYGTTVDSQDNVYSGDSSYNLTKFSSDGTKIWQKKLSGYVYSVAVDSQDNVYTGDDDHKLTKFSSDGTQMWQKVLANAVCSVVASSEGHIYTGESTGALTKFKEETNKGNAVNHPNHYRAYGMEAIDVIKNSMSDLEFQGYLKGNVMKYILRYRLKNGVQDLEKAEVYLNWIKESYEQGEE